MLFTNRPEFVMIRAGTATQLDKEIIDMTFPYIPGETVKVPTLAFKDTVTLSAADTALIIVDMQNDFVKPGGSLMVPAAEGTVGNIQRLLETARSAGMHVAYTMDTMFKDDPEFAIWPAHTVEGTWGWQIIDELKPLEGELICPKNRYDGFYGTWLEHFLTYVWRVKQVIIVGTVANICVLHTAAAAGLRWFHVVMPADGVSALTEFDQALTLHQVSSLYTGSIVRSVDDIEIG